jgi:large subunit ribosomal protein L13
MKTWVPTAESELDEKWWIVDAGNKKLGRLATEIARRLRGKHKPTFTPHADIGDFVIVINCEKVAMSGSKWSEKKYYRHSGYFGNLKARNAQEALQSDPAFILEEAVKGMLPKNKLSRRLIRKLKVYAGPEHPHAAQKPEALTINA